MKNIIQITCTLLCFFTCIIAFVSVANAQTTDIASTEVFRVTERFHNTPDIPGAGIPAGTADRPLLTSDGNDLEPVENTIPAVQFIPADFRQCLPTPDCSSRLLTGLLGLMLLGLVLMRLSGSGKPT